MSNRDRPPPDRQRPNSTAARLGRDDTGQGQQGHSNVTAEPLQRQYRLEIVRAHNRLQLWGMYTDRAKAEDDAARLRLHSINAQVREEAAP